MGDLALVEQQSIVTAVKRLFNSGIMSASGHGNVSTRLQDDPERIVLTRSGSIQNLTVDELAVLHLDGTVELGELASENAEIVEMHTAVYKIRPDVGAVIHTHSPHVTAFALANAPLPCRYESLLRFGQAEDIPVVAWGPRGSGESVRGILAAINHHPQTQAVLLANHGILAFSSDLNQTIGLLIAAEEAAFATLKANFLGGAKPFPDGALEQVQARRKSVAISHTHDTQKEQT